MNRLTRDHLEFVAGRGAERAEESWHAAARLRDLFGVEHLSRPVYLDAEQVTALERDLPALQRLVDELPARLCDGDMASFAKLCGATPAQVDAVLATRHPATWPVARADLFLGENGFTAFETNMAAVGGVEIGELCRAMLSIPEIGDFVSARQLTFTAPWGSFLEALDAEADRIGAGHEARIAVVTAPGDSPKTRAVFEMLAVLLEDSGYQAVACGLDELSYSGNKVRAEGLQVDLVLRYFFLDQVGGPAQACLEPLLEACRRDEVVLLAPFAADLVGSKRAFALPWHREWSGYFTEAERELVARLTPWSHVLRSRLSTEEDELVDTAEYCASNRAGLVLKGGMSQGGSDVVMGRDLTDGQWRAAVADGLRRGSVVQRLVIPEPENFTEGWPRSVVQRVINWGVYVIGGHYAGVMARGALADRSGIVSYDSGALLGCCFEEETGGHRDTTGRTSA